MRRSKSLLVLAVAVLLGASASGGTYSGGDGSAENPYWISTAADLNEIGTNSEDWGSYFILTNDIDLSAYTGTAFNIIAPDTDNERPLFQGTPFTGTFDGNGHIVSNFTYTSTGTDYIALFGYVASPGEIKNLGMVDVNVDAGTGYYVGGLVGLNDFGIVSNCYATATVTGNKYVGGLVGLNYYDGMVSNCYAAGTVSGVSWVGGLVGINHFGTVSNCYAAGNIFGSGSVGGLVGYNNYGTVSKCYATGTVSGVAYVGGLVGYDYFGTVTSSFWDIDTSGQATSAGGTGKTTVQMQTRSTFTDAGWDFVGETVNGTEDIWTIHKAQDYPQLVWKLVNFVGWYEVDFADYAFFANRWLDTNCGDSNDCDGCDLDFSDTVDANDLKIFADHWLEGAKQ